MKKLAFLMALLLAFTAIFTGCGKKDKLSGNDKNEQKKEELQAKQYTLLPGDYYSVAGTTVKSADSAIAEVVVENLVRAVSPGKTTLTASDGKKTVTHTVTVLDISDIKLTDDYKSVSQKELDKLFEEEKKSLIMNYGKYTEVTDRKDVRDGDKANISYIGKVDGVAFEGGTGTYDLVIGSGSFIAGFEEGLIGKEVGTTVDLDLTFPDPYPNNEDLAGKAVVFTVTINKISAPQEYTDEMVKDITGYENIEAFEEYLKTTIVTDLMFKKLTENTKISTIPQALKDQYYDAYVVDMIDYLSSMGMTVSTKEEIISMMGYTEKDFDDMVWETIGGTIEQDCIFFSYCLKNNIVLTKADYDATLARYLKMYNCKDLAELMKNYSLTYEKLYESFLYDKVMKDLYAKAEIVNDVDAE